MFSFLDKKDIGSLIPDGSTLAIGGAGAGHAVPDLLLKSLGKYFKANQHPKNLKTIHPCGIGDNDKRGLNHIAIEGLIETDIGGFWGNAPSMAKLAVEEKIKGYNLPQGILGHLMRASASKKPGIMTKVGLHTFVDPRLEGGKINKSTTEDLVHVMDFKGIEYLFYESFQIDVAFIRGTTIDKEGNITMEEEVGSFSMLSIAQAAKTNGGIVIAQVKQHIDGHTDPTCVKIPGCLIDYAVLAPDQEMTFISAFDPSLVKRDHPFKQEELSLEGIKMVISQRAAKELKKGNFVNLGYGMSDGVPIVAQQQKIEADFTFMIEQGTTGGIPTTGLNFGAMYNPSSIIDDGYQFDFFQGGGLDISFLGFAQIDQYGNVNSSRFGKVLTGCGGFIDISQNAKKIVFCGSFAVKGQVEVSSNGIQILHPGKAAKFINQVEQVSFSAKYALESGQEVLYVTERGTFQLTDSGLLLVEIAPGIDIEKDILSIMEFTPKIAKDLKEYGESVLKPSHINTEKAYV
jgi:propionate CoA-transferase